MEEYLQNESPEDEQLFDDEKPEPVEFISIDEGALPSHFRCASHTLSLIGTKDAKRAMDDPTYKMHFDQAFSKLNSLCKKFNRPKSSELIKTILGSSLVMPCATRWNSLYDSIKCILGFDVKLLNKAAQALALEEFTATDIEFFKE